MPETIEYPEKAILVGIFRQPGQRISARESVEELAELAGSAGALVVDSFIQERAHPDPAYLVGKGKLEEIRDCVVTRQADLVVFDEDLSPAQLRNLESFFDVKVVDRSELILDIFAQRARSREGKLQVSLAQLEYLLPRLTGRGSAMSRLGGGIGTRGPGETKLEVDRRTIRKRISRLKQELERLEDRRELHRQRRAGVPIPTLSLVGYTNAGKSTLFRRLTGQETFVSARMFATLDPLIRKIGLPSGQEVLLADTVGFIRKLPHTLVAAFHATLEETLEADLLLHVIDVTHEHFPDLREAVYRVLDEIGFSSRPVIEVYNKIDLLPESPPVRTPYPHCFVSARRGDGMEGLLGLVESRLGQNYREVELLIPFERGELVAHLRERAQVQKEEFTADGTLVRVALPLHEIGKYREWLHGAKKVSSLDRGETERRKIDTL